MSKSPRIQRSVTATIKEIPPVIIGRRDDGFLAVAVGKNKAGDLMLNVVEKRSEAGGLNGVLLSQLERFSPEGWEFDNAAIERAGS